METAHASTNRPANRREIAAKIAAVNDFHRNMQMELTGNHLWALEQRAKRLNALEDDQAYIERLRAIAREVDTCKCRNHAA